MADTEPVKEKKKKKTGIKSADGAKKSAIKKEEVSVTDENKESTIPNENGVEPQANTEPQQNEEKLHSTSQVAQDTPTATPSEKPTKEEKHEDTMNKTEIPEAKIERRRSERASRKASRKSQLFTEIDDQKLHQLKEAFTLFDFNRDGIIDRDDLRKSFIALGKEDITREEIDSMMSEALNPLDFDAFVILLGYKTVELDPEEVIRDALSRWDYDGSGLISEERIRHDLMTWGDKFTTQEVDYALEDAPLYRGTGLYQDDRMIDYVKFCSILCGLRKKTRDPQIEDFM